MLLLSRPLKLACIDSLCCRTDQRSTGQGMRCDVALRPVCCPVGVFFAGWPTNQGSCVYVAGLGIILCLASAPALACIEWVVLFLGGAVVVGGRVWLVWLRFFA